MHTTCYLCGIAFDSQFAMDLHHYIQPVHGDNSPDPKGTLSSTILQQAIAEVNKQVQ